MKKFLAMLMLLAMCFSCAAMAETTDEDLAAAKTYLFMMYKDLPETTMSDYEVVGVLNIGGIEDFVLLKSDKQHYWFWSDQTRVGFVFPRIGM